MKIGYTVGCANLNKIELAAKAGFDYVEVALNGVATCSEDELAAFIECLKKNGIPCEAANCLFPGSLKLCGESFNESAVEEYLEGAFSRASLIGIDTVVFGSGGSRKIPDGFSRNTALEQLRTVCTKYLEPAAAKYGITVVIEPLNKRETNVFNSVAETSEFQKSLELEHVKCLADTYHMDMENEPYSNVELAGKNLRHTHIANPVGRVFPLASDEKDYDEFFRCLSRIGYEGRISVEASVPEGMTEEQALCETLAFLRSIV